MADNLATDMMSVRLLELLLKISFQLFCVRACVARVGARRAGLNGVIR